MHGQRNIKQEREVLMFKHWEETGNANCLASTIERPVVSTYLRVLKYTALSPIEYGYVFFVWFLQ
jgi:hypothetical protein